MNTSDPQPWVSHPFNDGFETYRDQRRIHWNYNGSTLIDDYVGYDVYFPPNNGYDAFYSSTSYYTSFNTSHVTKRSFSFTRTSTRTGEVSFNFDQPTNSILSKQCSL